MRHPKRQTTVVMSGTKLLGLLLVLKLELWLGLLWPLVGSTFGGGEAFRTDFVGDHSSITAPNASVV
jgi:hypothetical protein